MVQGITELFPISSLGHSVILPKILNWNIKQDDPFFVTFLVATHTATALVLFFFFFKDWKRIISGFFRSLRVREIKDSDNDAKLAWLLIVATIPAGLLGIMLQKTLEKLFASPQLVAFVLILNGILLFFAEFLRKRVKENNSLSGNEERISKLNWQQAVKVGALQSIALIPGFSRTGSSMTGGLLAGLSHEDAARFSFLLATPIIAAASLLKLPDLIDSGKIENLQIALIGALFAGIFAFLSVKFLTKYFQTQKLWPFGLYCAAGGVGASLLFLLR